MTLKEALESGKPFKHKCWPDFGSATRYNHLMVSAEEAISNDWEIKKESRVQREWMVAVDMGSGDIRQRYKRASSWYYLKSGEELIKVREVIE